MQNFNFSRRELLSGAGMVPLIGTATAAEAYQPTRVAALKGSAKSVVITSALYDGDSLLGTDTVTYNGIGAFSGIVLGEWISTASPNPGSLVSGKVLCGIP